MNERRNAPMIDIENAEIYPYTNFSGTVDQYNKNGDKKFSIIIRDAEQAQQLSDEGWNVRIKQPKDGDPFYLLDVAVSFKFPRYAPNIVKISSSTGAQTVLNDDTVYLLDKARIARADLTLRGRVWNDEGDIKAFLSDMYVTVEESKFASRYARD